MVPSYHVSYVCCRTYGKLIVCMRLQWIIVCSLSNALRFTGLLFRIVKRLESFLPTESRRDCQCAFQVLHTCQRHKTFLKSFLKSSNNISLVFCRIKNPTRIGTVCSISAFTTSSSYSWSVVWTTCYFCTVRFSIIQTLCYSVRLRLNIWYLYKLLASSFKV